MNHWPLTLDVARDSAKRLLAQAMVLVVQSYAYEHFSLVFCSDLGRNVRLDFRLLFAHLDQLLCEIPYLYTEFI